MTHLALASLLIPLVAFWACMAALLTRSTSRARMRSRSVRDWMLDGSGLLVQGWLVPLGGAWLGRVLWAPLVDAGSWKLGFVGGFLLSVVVVDLLYYLNHRLLHVLWPLHRVHHTAPDMDVWVSARNTAWTTAFIVYPWANSLAMHALDVPAGFVLGAALTAALDLWRHSGLEVSHVSRLGLITPRHHAWHHATERQDVNFGANWSWWDRAFGTFFDPGHAPVELGVATGLSAWRDLLWPFGGRT